MKSKRAKEHIDELSSRHGLSVYQATQAIHLAEQDAEERAVEAFEQALQKLSESPKLTLRDMQQWVKDFKQLIGGQSDE